MSRLARFFVLFSLFVLTSCQALKTPVQVEPRWQNMWLGVHIYTLPVGFSTSSLDDHECVFMIAGKLQGSVRFTYHGRFGFHVSGSYDSLRDENQKRIRAVCVEIDADRDGLLESSEIRVVLSRLLRDAVKESGIPYRPPLKRSSS